MCSAPWLFRFTLLELVKGGYRGAKKGRGGRVECKGWNLTIDFIVDVLRQEGTRRVRMGSFWLLGVLLIYSSLLSHVTPQENYFTINDLMGGVRATLPYALNVF